MQRPHTLNEALHFMQKREGRQMRLEDDCLCPSCRMVAIAFVTATLLDDPEHPGKAVMTTELVYYIYNLAKHENT